MSTSKRSVLIVEDSFDLQMLLDSVLRREGYNVKCAGSGKEALETLSKMADLPNVILLDLMMEDMDGHDFRKAQLQDSRIAKIPVILMTADGHIQDRAHEVGAQAYLAKPFRDIDAILNTVARVMNP